MQRKGFMEVLSELGLRGPGGPWQAGKRRGFSFWFRGSKLHECSGRAKQVNVFRMCPVYLQLVYHLLHGWVRRNTRAIQSTGSGAMAPTLSPLSNVHFFICELEIYKRGLPPRGVVIDKIPGNVWVYCLIFCHCWRIVVTLYHQYLPYYFWCGDAHWKVNWAGDNTEIWSICKMGVNVPNWDLEMHFDLCPVKILLKNTE